MTLIVDVGTDYEVPADATPGWAWLVKVATDAAVLVSVAGDAGSINGETGGEVAAVGRGSGLVIWVTENPGNAPKVSVSGDLAEQDIASGYTFRSEDHGREKRYAGNADGEVILPADTLAKGWRCFVWPGGNAWTLKGDAVGDTVSIAGDETVQIACHGDNAFNVIKGQAAALTASSLALQGDLLRVLRFDEGSGSQVLDHSGNAGHGTIVGATRDPAGFLTFDGVDDRVDLDALPAEVHGVDIVFRPAAPVTTASTRMVLAGHGAGGSASGINLGPSSSFLSNEIVTLHQLIAGGYAADGRMGWTESGGSLSAGWHCLQMAHRPGDAQRWNVVVDGVARPRASHGTIGPILAAPWRIGLGRDGLFPFAGGVAYLVLYATAPSDAAQAANLEVYRQALAPRGITLP